MPISYVGLTPPKSLVTEEVKAAREEFGLLLRETRYYESKIRPYIMGGYPVEIGSNTALKVAINKIVETISKNQALIFANMGGAQDCFTKP